MKHLRVAEARARFGEVLDDAEKGAPVIIERRGVRFRVVAEAAQAPDAGSQGEPLFAHVDSAVMAGQWSWKPAAGGMAFAPRRKKR